MTLTLKSLRDKGSHLIPQDEGGLLIVWKARHIDPATLFAADALISALFDLSNSAEASAGGDDLAEAERLARSAEKTSIEKQRDELEAQQRIARSVVKSVSVDEGATWRAVEWVDSEDEESDRWEEWLINGDSGSWIGVSADQAQEAIKAGRKARPLPIGLHIGWISRKALTLLVWKCGVRLKEEEGSRFRGSRSEE